MRALLRTGLEGEGFAVVEAADGRQALALIESQPIGLVTLDLKLGGEDGLKVARDLRMAKNTPIIMITGKGDAVDRIVGLELGADDYIPKPFLMREVIARIRAVLRRYTAGSGRPAGRIRCAEGSVTVSTVGSSIFRGARCATPRAACAS